MFSSQGDGKNKFCFQETERKIIACWEYTLIFKSRHKSYFKAHSNLKLVTSKRNIYYEKVRENVIQMGLNFGL